MNIKNFQYYFNNNYFRIYDKLFPEERSQKEAQFLAKFIPSKDAQILDFGCAWGRHIKALGQMGYKNLTGVDFSSRLIQKARKNLRAIPNVKLYVSDFVSFRPKQKFNFIFHIFQAFGHEDREYDQLTISNAAKILLRGGHYLLDLRNPYKLFKGEKFDLPSGVSVVSRFDANKRREKFIYTFEGGKEIVEFNVYTKEELEKMFKRARLKVNNVFGGFDGSDYSEDSERLILIGEKKI